MKGLCLESSHRRDEPGDDNEAPWSVAALVHGIGTGPMSFGTL